MKLKMIEVDSNTLKRLLTMRKDNMTCCDVVKLLLDNQAITLSDDWVIKNTRFPVGTTFKGRHLGVEYIGVVKDSGLVLNGKKYQSPSAAAMSITNTQTNGWGFWDCLFPNTTEWRRIASIRRTKNS